MITVMVTVRKNQLSPKVPERQFARRLSVRQARDGLQSLAIILILVGLLVLALVSVVSGVTRNLRPDASLALRPGDAYAAARLVSAYSSRSGNGGDSTEYTDFARNALKHDPTAARALRALGELADRESNHPAAFARMALADGLTRRDLATQLWLFNHYLSQGDVENMLRHLDAAVSTSRDANGYLFPVLAASLIEPEIVPPIVDMLTREPWWNASLLAAIIEHAPDTTNAVAVFVALAERGHPARDDLTARLIARARSEGNAQAVLELESLEDRN